MCPFVLIVDPASLFYHVLRLNTATCAKLPPVTLHKSLERTGNSESTRGIFRAQEESQRANKINAVIPVHVALESASGKQSTDHGGFGDAPDGQDHCSGAWRNVVLAHGIHHFVKTAHHDFL